MAEPSEPHLSIHHVHIFVRDLDRSVEFYVEQLGFQKLFHHTLADGSRFVAITPGQGTAILGLIAPKPGTREHGLIGKSGNVVLVTDNLQAKYYAWKERGVVFEQDPQRTDWQATVTTLHDPDGNAFALVSHDEISRHLERERWRAREMELARDVQARLLPPNLPSVAKLDLAGRCLQAREVGGDYFDCLPLSDSSIGLIIGDISGKGIAAALLMANLQAVVRGFSGLAAAEPQRFLQTINEHVFRHSLPAAYATLFFGAYCSESGTFRYANCGHPAGLLLRADGSTEWLESTGMVLGLFPEASCETGTTQLYSGDTLVLYTDGVSEYVDAAGEEFGVALCGLIAVLFCVLSVRLLLRATRARDAFAQLAGAALASVVALQAFINMGVAMNMLPAKGMTLPFISYGGSSLFAVAMTMGFALSVTRQRPQIGEQDHSAFRFLREVPA